MNYRDTHSCYSRMFLLAVIAIAILILLLNRQRRTIIAVSGLSGSGKTTLAKRLAQEHGGAFIDLDDYFWSKDRLSRVNLSTGESVTLYDDYSAIDWDRFWRDVKYCESNLIFIAGFCLPPDEDFDYHFHLLLDKETCKSRRIVSKKFTGDRIRRDAVEVDEVVYPFYESNYLINDEIHLLIDEVIDATLPSEQIYEHAEGVLKSLGYLRD